MWREAGLLLTDDGLVVASNTTQSGLPEGDLMKEDMIANSLVWLSSRLCNFIAAGEGLNPIPAGDRSENDQIEEPGNFGKTQKSLLDQWYAFQHEFDLWFAGLPPTFKPSARLHPARQSFVHQNETIDCPFDEIWFALPMCASTMQHYHMARILLYINKPHETTARRITIGGRLNSYRYIDGQILHHCYEIWCVTLDQNVSHSLLTDQKWHRSVSATRWSTGSLDPTFVRSGAVPQQGPRKTSGFRSSERHRARPWVGYGRPGAATVKGVGMA